ncbi:MAG: adenylosuccinate synthetase [Candidatus Saccharimonadaceae bacterium]
METARIVTDLSFGDAGKGTTVDYLARQASTSMVVRYNGGAQAAHNVVTPDGRHHTFSQFGSGSFVDGAATHLSRFMMISPGMMMSEAEHLISLGLTDIWQRLTIDAAAPLIMPWHRAANQLRELHRGANRHGSVGIGISEVQYDLLADESLVVRVGELQDPHLVERLRTLQHTKHDQMLREVGHDSNDEQFQLAWEVLSNDELPNRLAAQYQQWLATGLRVVAGEYLQVLADKYESMIFEGSQGVLLDEWFGFHPYTTWSTTTSENALQLLSEITHSATVERLGVLRAYTTRHGPGPFVSEDPELAKLIPERHNGLGRWMGAFRYGHFDFVAHRYAVEANGGVDTLVVTGLDRSDSWRSVDQYIAPVADDLSEFFSLNKQGNIDTIKLGKKDDLVRQAHLSELLMACSPHFHSSGTMDGSHLLGAIEDTLGVPVGIASYGPIAVDKRVPIVC